MQRHVPRDQPGGARADAVAHRRRRRPPAGRAGGRRGRGSCWSTAAARACRRESPAGPAGPPPSASGGRAPLAGARRGARRCRSCYASLRSVAPAGGVRTAPASSAAAGARVGGRLAPSCGGGAASTGPRSWPRPGCRRARRWASRASRRRASPERLSGRGLAPLSAWRATFSPSSSNIARSSSGSEPSVVRKLPIITPFRPAFTASGWSSPRFSTRPPQRRNRAVGQDQAEDRDELHGLPRVDQRRGRRTWCPVARVEQVDRHAGGVDLGQLECHLDPLARASRRGSGSRRRRSRGPPP